MLLLMLLLTLPPLDALTSNLMAEETDNEEEEGPEETHSYNLPTITPTTTPPLSLP